MLEALLALVLCVAPQETDQPEPPTPEEKQEREKPPKEQVDPETREIRELIGRLLSNDVGERDDATGRLRKFGEKAVPELEKAAAHSDREVSARAKRVLALLRVRGELTPLLEAMPGAENRLASMYDRDWTRLLIEAADKKRYPNLTSEHLDVLAARALRGALTAGEKIEVCRIVAMRRLHSGTKEVGKLLLDPFPDVMRVADEALRILDTQAAAAEVIALIPVQDTGKFVYAAQHVNEFRREHAVPELAKLLNHQRKTVRLRAARWLAWLNSPEPVPMLRMLLEDLDRGIREEAAYLLSYYRTAEAIPVLREGLAQRGERERCPVGRGWHDHDRELEALGRIGSRDTYKDIAPFVFDQDETVRLEAVKALAEVARSRQTESFVRALRDKAESVRQEAVKALGKLENKEVLPDILRCLGDDDVGVRTEAARVLAELGGVEYAPELVRLLKSSDYHDCWLATRALMKLEKGPWIKEVMRLLESENPGDRWQAIDTLGWLEAEEASEKIAAMIGDPEPRVAGAAVYYFARVPEGAPVAALSECLTREDMTVRFLAAESLCGLGSRKGFVPYLQMRETQRSGSLVVLNGVRRPELWKKLRRIKVPRREGGNRVDSLEYLAAAAGLKLEVVEPATWEQETRLRLGRSGTVYGGGWVRELGLQMAATARQWDAIVDDGVLRIVPYDDALKFWQQWWQEENRPAEKKEEKKEE